MNVFTTPALITITCPKRLAPWLELEVKELIIEVLQLEDITPDDIDSAAPLFVEGLGLDSIDALELGVALQKKYGISLSADSEDTRRHFASVAALAAMKPSAIDDIVICPLPDEGCTVAELRRMLSDQHPLGGDGLHRLQLEPALELRLHQVVGLLEVGRGHAGVMVTCRAPLSAAAPSGPGALGVATLVTCAVFVGL